MDFLSDKGVFVAISTIKFALVARNVISMYDHHFPLLLTVLGGSFGI